MSFRRVPVDAAWNVTVASTSESGALDQMRRSGPHRSQALSQRRQIRAQSTPATLYCHLVGVLHQLPILFRLSSVD